MLLEAPTTTTDVEPTWKQREESLGELARLFKVLGDETRFRIMLHIVRRERSVVELCRLVNHSQPLVSHHLSILRTADILKTRREGKYTYYSIRPSRFEQLMNVLALREDDHPTHDALLQYLFNPGMGT
ncbi:MAG: metalloregulator ArsR/SmtB family transcription factor [Planctomycetales bacterium]